MCNLSMSATLNMVLLIPQGKPKGEREGKERETEGKEKEGKKISVPK